MPENPRKTSSTPKSKAEVLAIATESLTQRVGTLADAVQVNNYKIDLLRNEVDKKPDDEEVRFITGLAQQERAKHLKWAFVTGVVCAVLSGGVAAAYGQHQLHERNKIGYSGCVTNNQRAYAVRDTFENVAKIATPRAAKEIKEGAVRVEKTILDCEKRYPKEKR